MMMDTSSYIPYSNVIDHLVTSCYLIKPLCNAMILLDAVILPSNSRIVSARMAAASLSK